MNSLSSQSRMAIVWGWPFGPTCVGEATGAGAAAGAGGGGGGSGAGFSDTSTSKTCPARTATSRSKEIHLSPSNLSRYVPAIRPVKLMFPLPSVSPFRVVVPVTPTWIPGKVAPFISVTVIAMPERLLVAGGRRGAVGAGVVAGGVGFGAGAVAPGAGAGAGFGWPVPCCGFAGVAGACALIVMMPATTKLDSRNLRMVHIIYRSRRV